MRQLNWLNNTGICRHPLVGTFNTSEDHFFSLNLSHSVSAAAETAQSHRPEGACCGGRNWNSSVSGFIERKQNRITGTRSIFRYLPGNLSNQHSAGIGTVGIRLAASKMGDAGGWDFHSDDEDEVDYHNLSKSALVVIISCSPDMFRLWGTNPDKPIVAALKCCHSMWRTKVISSPSDKVAILLMGTENTQNSDFPNLYVLQEMSTIKASMINDLQKLIQDSSGLTETVGASTDYDMRNTFWQAKIMFEEGNTKGMSKKIMLFTCEDNPHGDQPNLQEETIQKYQDLGSVDFSIATFYPTFDPDKFYSKLITDESAIIQAKDCESLLKVVRIKQRLKRPITRTTMELAPEIKFSVGVYSLIRKAAKPKAVKVDSSNKLVDRKVSVFDKETGQAILKAEENKFIVAGGEKAVFTPSEIKDLKYNFNVGIFLIGFLDEDKMDPYSWFREPGYFLYPDDDKIKGSKEIFTALLRRCFARKKIALVRFVLTRGRNPKLGCLVPSMGDKCQFGPEFPQGFHLIVLPFADEIRHHDVFEESEATTEMVEIVENIVRKLTQKNFSVSEFPNPTLYRQWRAIEGSALNLTDDDDFHDPTQPNVALMEARAGTLMRDFNACFRNLGYSSTATATASKVKAIKSDGGGGREAKKPKLDFDMKNEWKHKRLEKLTVATLKEFTDKNKISVTGSYTNHPNWIKKADYIHALDIYFSS